MKEFNPWDVPSLEVFHLYCCPECDSKHVTRSHFVEHALDQHEKARESMPIEMDEISLNDDTKHALDQHSKAKVLIPMVGSTSDLTNDPLALDHEKEENCDESITVKEEPIESILEIKCDICDYKAYRKGWLTAHIKNIHEKN